MFSSSSFKKSCFSLLTVELRNLRVFKQFGSFSFFLKLKQSDPIQICGAGLLRELLAKMLTCRARNEPAVDGVHDLRDTLRTTTKAFILPYMSKTELFVNCWKTEPPSDFLSAVNLAEETRSGRLNYTVLTLPAPLRIPAL